MIRRAFRSVGLFLADDERRFCRWCSKRLTGFTGYMWEQPWVPRPLRRRPERLVRGDETRWLCCPYAVTTWVRISAIGSKCGKSSSDIQKFFTSIGFGKTVTVNFCGLDSWLTCAF